MWYSSISSNIRPTPLIIRSINSDADAREKVKLLIAPVIDSMPDKVLLSQKEIDKLVDVAFKYKNKSITREEVILELRGGGLGDLIDSFIDRAKFTMKVTIFTSSVLWLYFIDQNVEAFIPPANVLPGVNPGICKKPMLPPHIQSLDNILKDLGFPYFIRPRVIDFLESYRISSRGSLGPLFGQNYGLEKNESSKYKPKFKRKKDGFENFGGPKGLSPHDRNMAKLDLYMQELNATQEAKHMQAKFYHPIDFGVEGNFNMPNLKKYMANVRDHMNKKSIKIIRGTHRKKIPVYHYFDPETKLNIMLHESNRTVHSGWRLDKDQIEDLMNNANVQ